MSEPILTIRVYANLDDGGYTIESDPPLNYSEQGGVVTQGDNIIDAILNYAEALELWIEDAESG
jgi:predicted RNase H-like HicB family nuclease